MKKLLYIALRAVFVIGITVPIAETTYEIGLPFYIFAADERDYPVRKTDLENCKDMSETEHKKMEATIKRKHLNFRIVCYTLALLPVFLIIAIIQTVWKPEIN